MPTIYTVGYARLREPERLAHLAAELDAVVVDVRFKPYTSFKGWSRADLHARLGSSYRWVEAFGNEGYRGGPVRLHDAARGLADVTPLLEVGNIILLCGCADPATCHRRLVADRLAEVTGCPVEHLLADKPPSTAGDEGARQLPLW